MSAIELWAGIECTINRVGDRYFDQLAWSRHAAHATDIDRLATLGVRTVRYPLLWERLAPHDPADIDWRWADDRMIRLRAQGLTPIVGLVHHGSGPAYTSLVDERFPELLARYARAIAERYPWVNDWTPINEPLTTARFSGLYGHWYPHGRSDSTFVRALVTQLRGVVLAMDAIREVNPDARLVQTEDVGRPDGTERLRDQVEHEAQRRWLTWDLLCGRVNRDHPLYAFLHATGAATELDFFLEHPCAPDTLGINYYLTSDRWLDDRLHLYPAWSHGGNGRTAYADVEAVRARPGGIVGHEQHLLDAWERYRLPVALTEVHLGCTREEQMRWLVEAWEGAHRARARGANVRAATLWAALGSHEWHSLVTREDGHYEPGAFDVRSPEPRATAIASVAASLAGGRVPDHPVLRTAGWWRRTSTPSLSAPPILVVGSRGTLGRAFRRLCLMRGLRVELAGRPELDICDPSRIDAVLRRVEPWAVVNAAGYVRVDEAEADRDTCWRDNVTGALNLAGACRRRRLPLVTFSSDLVFDGSANRPYVEDDPTAPLGVYGATKAEAERRVLDLLPDALVIRTSAFFGPWDDYNFATVALREMRLRRRWRAADDYAVSPTYVPDLVNAALDLLIDGTHGLWHLANDGSLTWCDFARLIAREAGLSEELVEPCSWRDVWGPAPRPRQSVLASARGRLMRPIEAAVREYVAEAVAVAALERSAR